MIRETSFTQNVLIASLYKFSSFPDFAEHQQLIRDKLTKLGIRGTLLLAKEGINGTLAGYPDAVREALELLKKLKGFHDLKAKISTAEDIPFLRLKIRLKKEIVTIGRPEVNPKEIVGTYVKPGDWNSLIQEPDVLLIDTRNNYEVSIGTFENAHNPKTGSFREFPDYVEHKLGREKNRKIALFCTGGIRCEKASSFMKAEGFEQVFHLEGGILKYLEDVRESESLWRGECFVFDDRVSVDRKLQPGSYKQCFGCRRPLSEQDLRSAHYERGVSCPHCFHRKSAPRRASYRERQQQIDFARKKGIKHLGACL